MNPANKVTKAMKEIRAGAPKVSHAARKMAASALKSMEKSNHVGISAFNYGVAESKIPKLIEDMKSLPEMAGITMDTHGFMGYISFYRKAVKA